MIPIVYPIPKTRKGLKIMMIIMIAISVGISIFVFISWAAEKKALEVNGQPDFNTLKQGELADGMTVTGTINLAVDWYAEEYETGYFGTRTSDDSEALYYLVPVYQSNADGTVAIQYFVTFKAKPKDFDTMDAVVNQTWSNDPMTALLTLDYADVDDLSGELAQYMNEYVNDKNFYENGSFIDWCVEYNILGTTNRTEIASKLAPYVISRTTGPENTFGIACLFAGIALVCLAIFLVLQLVKRPIKGVIDTTPMYEDFSKVRQMDDPSARD
jgi:hypothetical protein